MATGSVEIPASQVIDRVEASLFYMAPATETPITYRYTPAPGTPDRSPKRIAHRAFVYNARAIAADLSLDREGFILVNHESATRNFYDEAEVQRVYYPEVERLVKRMTGAPRVLVFDHIVRYAPMAERGENKAKSPAKAVHNDYTAHSGPKRVRDLLPDEADELLKHRFAIINVWQPTNGPVLESPLAVCDARSIAPQDWIRSELHYAHRIGETYGVAFNPNHRWFYFSRMQRDEAMLLKCYDSDDRRARFTAHTAFDDPTSPPDAPPRESIEARALVFFAPKNNS
ncbi:MAG: CmcJ/NvfI family oxidoreductase [Candidatus Binataceae bacterium]